MPVPKQTSRDLEKALAKLRKAFENNQGACLLKHEASAVYAELLEKLKQDANQEEPSHL
jgi:hypothetical protein